MLQNISRNEKAGESLMKVHTKKWTTELNLTKLRESAVPVTQTDVFKQL